jgi:AcrR family transcriptional regulator
MKPEEPTRKRDAVATRAAILASARKAFAAAGYDGAGVREIAANAGVTAMMVNHYFGSKEQLFAAVLEDVMRAPAIITPSVLVSEGLARAIANALVTETEVGAPPLDGFMILLKSVANPRAAEIGRVQIERYHQQQMTGALGGDEAGARAAVVLSLVAGFQLMRQMFGLRPLTDADPAALADIVASALAPLTARKG